MAWSKYHADTQITSTVSCSATNRNVIHRQVGRASPTIAQRIRRQSAGAYVGEWYEAADAECPLFGR
jgi:hypothetical protein